MAGATPGGRAITTVAACESAVTSGRYAELAARGEAPALLSGNPRPALAKAVIAAESAKWEAIGLGAITDFVQQAFGPVELDRSLVELTVTAAPRPGCPACAGRRFKFPADLADSRDRMCAVHRREADAVIRRRMGRAEASNLAGWRMLADASARLSLPHLPGGLATRLAAADKDLVRRARLLAEATAGFAGRPDDFGSALWVCFHQQDPPVLVAEQGAGRHPLPRQRSEILISRKERFRYPHSTEVADESRD